MPFLTTVAANFVPFLPLTITRIFVFPFPIQDAMNVKNAAQSTTKHDTQIRKPKSFQHLVSRKAVTMKSSSRVSKGRSEDVSTMLLPKVTGKHLSHDLVVDQLLQLLLAQVILVFVKIEELLRDWESCWFIFGIVVGFEVWML